MLFGVISRAKASRCSALGLYTLTRLNQALLSIVGWFFAYRLVPETKGLSLETIERFWVEGRPIREWH
jgi:hypothetical protein